MKQTLLLLFLGGSIAAGVFALNIQNANALKCSWTQYEYRCTDGYWTSQYECTWYDPAPYQSCTSGYTTQEQCGWEVQCDADDTNCHMAWVCTTVTVPTTNCTTIDPAPYKTCEYNSVWVPGSCGNYPTYKSQTCPANSETSCSYATDCSTSGSKNVTSYSCGSSGCQANTTPATCTRTFPTCTNNVGETGNVCGGSCTAPPDKTLTVSVAVTPSSGSAPLKNIQIDASVGGTATGTITYKLDCTNDLVYDATETSSSTSYAFTKKCDYDTAGTYTARVNVTRQTLGISNTASVTVTTPTLTFPSDRWQRLWYTTSGASPTFSTSNFLGEGPNESIEEFTNDWVGNAIAYGKDKTIGFKSSRTINFPFAYTYRFTVGADDGFRLSIDGVEKLSEWNDNNYDAHVRTVDMYLAAGNHTFQLDYYENEGNAKVSFGYELAPCNKASSVTPSTFLMEVPSATLTGKKSITATVSHWGADNDGSGVILERNFLVERAGFFGNPLGGARVHLDDLGTGAGSTGDCDDDVVWDTVWFNEGLGSTRLEIRRFNADFKGRHTLTYGYEIALAGAVFKATGSRTASASASVSGTGSGPITFGVDNGASNITYGVVECTQDSHCSADPNKAYCNGAATRTTANFPLNTCIDSVAPTSKITTVEDNSKKQPGFAVDVPAGAVSAFLKGDNNGDTTKTWWLYIEDTDNTGGSGPGLNTCYISINGVTKPARWCTGWVSFTVGKDYPETLWQDADCTAEGIDACKIKVWAQDKAGNKNDATVLEQEIGNPSAVGIKELDERKYNDFTAYPKGFNVFNFGVDWTPPTAQ